MSRRRRPAGRRAPQPHAATRATDVFDGVTTLTAWGVVYASATDVAARLGMARSTVLRLLRELDVEVLRRRDGYWIVVEDFRAKVLRARGSTLRTLG